MAPRHVFATAHGGACYLKCQNGFGRLGGHVSLLQIDAMGTSLLPWRHNSGALETTNMSESFSHRVG
jgi:hypothetical protein